MLSTVDFDGLEVPPAVCDPLQEILLKLTDSCSGHHRHGGRSGQLRQDL